MSRSISTPRPPISAPPTYDSSARAFTIGVTEGQTALVVPNARTKDADRPSYQVLHEKLEGTPIVTVLGSHKNVLVDGEDKGSKFEVVSPRSKLFLAGVCEVCVASNVNMQNGGADTGFMGAASEAFVKARAEFGADKTKSHLVLQPLYFNSNATNEPPSQLGCAGYVSRTHVTFVTRTGGMYGIGDPTTNIYFPAGLGGSEELVLGAAAATIGSKCHGPYYRRNPPSCFAVVDDTFEGRVPKGYYAGFKSYLGVLQRLGLMRDDVANRFYFTGLENPIEEVALLAPWLTGERSATPKTTRVGINEAQARKQLLIVARRRDEVRTSLEEMLGGGPSFLPIFLSHVYAEFLARRAEQAAANLGSGIVHQLVDRSIADYSQIVSFLVNSAQRPTVELVGFNKDLGPQHHRLQAWFTSFAHTLAAGAADKNYDFMITGDGRNGIHAGTFAAWEDRARARAANGKLMQSRFVRVQMDVDGQVTAPLVAESGLTETVLPAMCSIESAAALVSLIGRPKVYVVACHGPVEAYREVFSTLLYRQLKDVVINGFQDFERAPKVFFVSPKSSSFDGYWFDGLKLQFRTFERFGATYPGNFDGVNFIGFGDDNDMASATIAARSILKSVNSDFGATDA